MVKALTTAQVIAGEAVSGSYEDRWNDMVNIASVIANRAALLGVTPEQVVSTTQQFNAYNKQMPPGTASLTDMAQQAMDYVAVNGPVNDATFYATPAATKNLPKGLSFETETTGHQYFSDPKMRSIKTSLGDVKPDQFAYAKMVENAPTPQAAPTVESAMAGPYTDNGLTNGVTAMTAPYAKPNVVTSQAMAPTAVDPAYSPSGLLAGDPQTFAGLLSSPAQNNFGDLAAAGPISAPIDGVGATGLLGGIPAQSAQANVGAIGVNPSAENWAGLEAPGAATVSMLNNQSPSERMGIISNPMSAMAQGSDIQRDYVSNPDDKTGRLQGDVAQTADMSRMMAPEGQIASADSALQASINQALSQPDRLAQNSFGDLAAAGAMQSVDPSTNQTTGRLTGNVAQTADPARINAPEGQIASADAALNASIQAALNSPQVPNTDNFGLLAAANPVSAPMNVQATGLLGGLPTEASATVPNQGINSPSFQAIAAQAQQNLAEMQSQPTPTFAAPQIATPTQNSFSDLAAANIANPGLLSGYAEQASVPAGIQAINDVAPVSTGLLSSTPIAAQQVNPTTVNPAAINGYQQLADTALAGGIIGLDGTKTINLNGDLNASNPMLDGTQQTPNFNTVQSDQLSIEGPAKTNIAPAVETQQTQQIASQPTVSQPSATGIAGNAKKGILSGLLNKETAIGGLLGAATLGPVGGVIGGLLGSQAAKNGGLTGLLSGAPMTINNIGTGLANTSAVYGGAPAGTQATASDGQTVTSLGNGKTAVTNKFGVTTVFGPNNTTSSYFGPSLFGGTSHTTGTPGGGGGSGGLL